MNSATQLVAVGSISLLAAGGTFWVKGPPLRTLACDVTSLKPDEVCFQQIPADAKVLWVDARSRKDWKKNGLKGSVLWNLDQSEDMSVFEAEIVPLILETPRVIVYCGGEECGLSRQVANRIRSLDLGAEVSVLRGGWDALRDAGRVKDSSSGP
jgi:rhodanese-related sulfurtransferase